MLAQKQPYIKRVRNSSLVEWMCAEDVTGLKHTSEALELLTSPQVFAQRRPVVRRKRETTKEEKNAERRESGSGDRCGEVSSW